VKRSARAAVVVAFVAYLATVAVLVFDPSQHAPGTSLALVSRVLRAAQLPVPAHSPLEVASNVVLFVPFSLLGLLIWPSRRVLGWTAAGALLSATIELVQLVFLPHRFATVSDVVANTTGALLGALLATGVLLPVLRHKRWIPPHSAGSTVSPTEPSELI
jgi:VanZ family protein